jgi:hypothetical protein
MGTIAVSWKNPTRISNQVSMERSLAAFIRKKWISQGGATLRTSAGGVSWMILEDQWILSSTLT